MLINSLLFGKNVIFSQRWNEYMMDLWGDTYNMPDDFGYRVIEVDKDYIARPDLISKILYGDTQYGDLICRLNGISNPFELNEGTKLVVPTVSDLPKFAARAELPEFLTDDNNRVLKPVPKKKKEKRGPNEAILGDSRFKIDRTNRIIIY